MRAGGLILGLVLALAGCAMPEGPAFDPSPAAAAAPRPMLGPTAPMREALGTAGADVERLAEAGTALGGRSAALQARAAALQGPVIPQERRERLLRAGAGAGP